MYLSASKIKAAIECGWKLYMMQNEKKFALYFEKGKYVHNIMEKALKGETDKLSEEELLDLEERLKNLDGNLQIFDDPDYQVIEKEQATLFDDDTMLWVPDVVQVKDKMAIIVDWKSGMRPYTNDEIKTDIQAKIYAYFLLTNKTIVGNNGKEYKIDVDHVFFNFAFTETGIVKQIIYKRGDIMTLKKEIKFAIMMYKQITGQRSYQTNIGSWCNYCECKRVCLLNMFYSDNKKIEIPENDDHWHLIFSKYHITKKYLDDIEEVLKSYAAENGLEKIHNVMVKVNHIQKYTPSKSKAALEYFTNNFPEEYMKRSIDYKKMTDDEKDEAIKKGFLKESGYTTVSMKIKDEKESENKKIGKTKGGK